ncbi:basic leucine zipper transcription factor [Lithospermum erythrorhizon]|uniref:Basic leucine zipper transcription factor n=1 Tax=Lithospermum erythrorhizon TaxID=34254 RepID=A0AAV3NWR5_LITER
MSLRFPVFKFDRYHITIFPLGELDFSNQEMFSSSNMMDLPSSCSIDSFDFIDELLKDSHACTHAHTCNPPGPDNSHTHTCYHVHTKLVPSASEDKNPTDDTAVSKENRSKKRPLGNREAVRKYREKMKAMTASLEEEVVRLRAMNQQLLKRLQGQALLEAEVSRLKCLLVDIRGRIEGEIGSFPYQNPTKTGDVYQNIVDASIPGTYMIPSCNMQCTDQVYCLHPGSAGKSTGNSDIDGSQNLNGCEFENLQCLASQDPGSKELPGCGFASGVLGTSTFTGNKRKGESCTPFLKPFR